MVLVGLFCRLSPVPAGRDSLLACSLLTPVMLSGENRFITLKQMVLRGD